MLINPTKKALSLFSTLPQVSDSQASKAFSTANPFFPGMPIIIMCIEKKS